MKRYLIPKFFASALIILLIFVSSNVISQEKKRNKNVENTQHSPKKATLYALVRGLGQIYNRKYWKLPIVYAGFAATGYFGVTNRTEYLKFNEAYICLENEGD